MASRYDRNTKARAVRLVCEHRDDYDGEWAAMKAISARLGMNTETLRKWVRPPGCTRARYPGSRCPGAADWGGRRRSGPAHRSP